MWYRDNYLHRGFRDIEEDGVEEKKKKMVIIPENDLDWFSQTSSVKRLPRQQTHPHYPNSWPSITTWHHYNTLSLTPPRQNSHYIHLLWALHSTDTHPSRGKGLRVGKFTHSERIWIYYSHLQIYSSHLLVLHNTCHCLPIHHQICTPLSHRRRCITRALTRCRSIAMHLIFLCLEDSYHDTSTHLLGCWC